jgi:hypothetical protein
MSFKSVLGYSGGETGQVEIKMKSTARPYETAQRL